ITRLGGRRAAGSEAVAGSCRRLHAAGAILRAAGGAHQEETASACAVAGAVVTTGRLDLLGAVVARILTRRNRGACARRSRQVARVTGVVALALAADLVDTEPRRTVAGRDTRRAAGQQGRVGRDDIHQSRTVTRIARGAVRDIGRPGVATILGSIER